MNKQHLFTTVKILLFIFGILTIIFICDKTIPVLIDNEFKCWNFKKGFHILTYTPGYYVLTPKDYYCAENFAVEMWAGGGSGSCSSGRYPDCVTRGGGGGAYISFNIKTYMKNIIINVGKGGIGNIISISNCIGKSGENSWFNSYNLNFTVEGGTTGCLNTTNKGKGGYVFTHTEQNIIAINGTNGTDSLCTYGSTIYMYCSGSGGSSGLYNNGGRTICSYYGYGVDDGKIPGGGGNSHTCNPYLNLSKGGDGLIKIYLSI